MPIIEGVIHWRKMLNCYVIGDCVGSCFESLSGPVNSRELRTKFNRRLQLVEHDTKRMNNPDYTPEIYGPFCAGTDESDIALNYMRFALRKYFHPRPASLPFSMRDEYLADWLRFLSKNRGAVRYGQTMKRHFSLMRFLSGTCASDELVAKVWEISRDRDSFGNACLALVFPYFIHSRKAYRSEPNVSYKTLLRNQMEHKDILEVLVSLTHAHTEAVEACLSLYDFFMGGGDWNKVRKCVGPPNRWRFPEMTVNAKGCLAAASYCAFGADDEYHILDRAAKIGGDMDSYLSLAFLMWHYDHCQTHATYVNGFLNATRP